MSEYEPFGDEWKAEVMRLKKSEIVDMLAEALREKAATKQSVHPTGYQPLEDSPWQTGERRGAVIPSNRNSR